MRCAWIGPLTLSCFVGLTIGLACNSTPEFGEGPGGEGNGGGGEGGDSFGGPGIKVGDGDGDGDGPNLELDLQACEGEGECPAGTTCKYELCIPNLGDCTSNGDCPGDSYCDADDICVPYGVDPEVINDPTCKRADEPPDPIPAEQCRWEATNIRDIYTTPVVADLNLDGDPNKLQPSIVVTAHKQVSGERIGMLQIIDGRTCEGQLSVGDFTDPNHPNRPGYASQLAIGDLDGDRSTGGRPEIVGLHRVPAAFDSDPPLQPIAWKITGTGDSLAIETHWKGRVCGGANDGEAIRFGNEWLEFGPGLFDLNDDGDPEVVIDKFVFDSSGCILNDSVVSAGDVQAAVNALYEVYLAGGGANHKGAISTVADVDLDGAPELVRADGIYEWVNDEWVLESYANNWAGKSNSIVGSAEPGHVAVADFGEYSSLPGQGASDPLPEIVVVSAAGGFNANSTGTVRVMQLDGTIVYSREIPDEGASCVEESCHGGHGGPPTASDFDGDGQVEFAAAANVYYAVYDPDCVSGGVPTQRPGGACDRTGNPLPPADQDDGILWAQPSRDYSSSQTGSSIFDFDGNGTAEAVYRDEDTLYVFDGATGAVVFSGPASSGTGSEYPTIVDVDGDFATEIVYGNQDGVTILKEPEDLWVSSRPIWNQHAYSVTHVTDNGTIRRTRDWTNNWQTEGLNNFRQNTQGELGALSLADLTVELAELEAICDSSGELTLYARVCNRGTNPVQDGAQVAFFEMAANAPDSADGVELCETVTETLLGVGDCTVVQCDASVSAGSDVFVLVDPEGKIPDCHPGNNDGSGASTLCAGVR